MKITTEQYNEFWNEKGQYKGIIDNNKNRFNENILAKIEEFSDSDKLDDYVCSMKKGRESTRRIIVEFYDYLIKDENCTELRSSCLFNKRFFDYPFERQLEIAKYLHEPRTPKEIEDRFDIDARTLRKDLLELEKGITVLGSTIQIEKEKKGRKLYYRTTVHPIFLALNLTEVYALTVYLNRVLGKSMLNDPNAKMIRSISNRIKTQLSDYAFDFLFEGEERPLIKNKYYNDEEYARKNILMYLMKSGINCKFIWHGKQFRGTIEYFVESGEYKVVTDKGEILDADIRDVDFVVDDLEYR